MSEFLRVVFNLVTEYCCGFNSAGLLLALIQEKCGQNIKYLKEKQEIILLVCSWLLRKTWPKY